MLSAGSQLWKIKLQVCFLWKDKYCFYFPMTGFANMNVKHFIISGLSVHFSFEYSSKTLILLSISLVHRKCNLVNSLCL